MNRLQESIAAARSQERSALIAFLAAGDPTLDESVELVRAVIDAGADMVEIGLPFSDPLADGPVIQSAYARALAAGIRTADVLRLVERVAPLGAPVVIMSAWNPIRAAAPDVFVRDASSAGAAALLVPDLLLEDSGPLRDALSRERMESVFLAAPWGSTARIEAAALASTGFVYLLARRGVTGSGRTDRTLEPAARRLSALGVPVAVGFGLADAAAAADVARFADAVVVGSRLVSAAAEARRTGGTRAAVTALRTSVTQLMQALALEAEARAAEVVE